MKTEFTKQDWRVNSANKTEVNSVNGIAIAECHISVMISQKEKEANAKLIAAAPDLLSVLAESLSYLPTNHPIQKKAKAAINKATA